MSSVRSPQSAFDAALKAARSGGSHAKKTISVTEARKALEALAPLSSTKAAEAVAEFLDSKKAGALSPAAKDALKAYLEAKRGPITLPTMPTGAERFGKALDEAMKHGKVKGQITKGEAQHALKQLAQLSAEDGNAAVAAFLAGPNAKQLSKAARALFDDFLLQNPARPPRPVIEIAPERPPRPVIEIAPERPPRPVIEIAPERPPRPVIEIAPERPPRPVIEIAPERPPRPVIEIAPGRPRSNDDET
ncbi:MAG: hypothetical protein HYS27_04165 [Deltaproteobacteria bacterium]|nr:hypothetical protein [Deltaproteobacteria bacterium]